jgi:hypothetical protein
MSFPLFMLLNDMTTQKVPELEFSEMSFDARPSSVFDLSKLYLRNSFRRSRLHNCLWKLVREFGVNDLFIKSLLVRMLSKKVCPAGDACLKVSISAEVCNHKNCKSNLRLLCAR